MDILSLSLKASAEAMPAFGPEKGSKSVFAESFAGAKGLAPPGTAPPPNPPLAKSGEEGATPEPIAPTQDPDFSPDLRDEIDPRDPNILIDFNVPAAKPKEPVKTGDQKLRDDPSAESLQTVACFGVINVPFEELPNSVDLSSGGIPTKAPIEREQGWTGSWSGLLSDCAIEPSPWNGQRPKKIDPTGERPKLWKHGAEKGIPVDFPTKPDPILQLPQPFTGERPKLWKQGAEKGIPVDFPTKPDPILQLPQPFTGERPKKFIDPMKGSDTTPVATPKPLTDASAGPVVVVNGSRPQKPFADAAPINSDKQELLDKIDPNATSSRPTVIDLRHDVPFKEPVLELPNHPSSVTDPFIPEKPTNGEVKETAEQKKSTKDAVAVDEAKPADVAKIDPAKTVNDQNIARPLRPIPKPEINPASEKEDLKVKPAESKPSAEAIATPKPHISMDKAPDLAPKQADEVVRQVLDRIDALAASKGRRVTVHLDPKEFGSITLVVGRKGGEVDAEIYASDDRVRQALEVNRPALAAGLDQRGIELSSMTVGSQLPHGSGRHEQALQDAARHHHHNMSRFEKSETTTLSLDAIRGLARKTSGVDLWI